MTHRNIDPSIHELRSDWRSGLRQIDSNRSGINGPISVLLSLMTCRRYDRLPAAFDEYVQSLSKVHFTGYDQATFLELLGRIESSPFSRFQYRVAARTLQALITPNAYLRDDSSRHENDDAGSVLDLAHYLSSRISHCPVEDYRTVCQAINGAHNQIRARASHPSPSSNPYVNRAEHEYRKFHGLPSRLRRLPTALKCRLDAFIPR